MSVSHSFVCVCLALQLTQINQDFTWPINRSNLHSYWTTKLTKRPLQILNQIYIQVVFDTLSKLIDRMNWINLSARIWIWIQRNLNNLHINNIKNSESNLRCGTGRTFKRCVSTLNTESKSHSTFVCLLKHRTDTNSFTTAI